MMLSRNVNYFYVCTPEVDWEVASLSLGRMSMKTSCTGMVELEEKTCGIGDKGNFSMHQEEGLVGELLTDGRCSVVI